MVFRRSPPKKQEASTSCPKCGHTVTEPLSGNRCGFCLAPLSPGSGTRRQQRHDPAPPPDDTDEYKSPLAKAWDWFTVAFGGFVLVGLALCWLFPSFGEMVERQFSRGEKAAPVEGSGNGGSSANGTQDDPLQTDRQFFQYVRTKVFATEDEVERVQLLEDYLKKYPNGEHVGEATALVERARKELREWNEAQKVGTLVVDCKVTLGSGQTVPVMGWIQVFENRPNRTAEDLIKYVHGTPQVRKAEQDYRRFGDSCFEQEFVSKVGFQYQRILKSCPLVAQGRLHGGRIAFDGLPPSVDSGYLIYGCGVAGKNFVGMFGSMRLFGGKRSTLEPSTYAVYPDKYGSTAIAHVGWRALE
ncbi:MAG: hypothetical protein HN976_31690 [Lentisphaerae bacterium]|nr:hypothetical protein [Lentisphaerota bacterium]MBT7059703.1 hypothetical protein [Lentisphaerota bacterium]